MKFIRTDRLKSFTDLIPTFHMLDQEKYCFRSGTINTWESGMFMSSKTEIDFFEGYMPCHILKELISRCDDGYMEVGPYQDDLMFRLRGNVKSHIYTFPLTESYFPHIDLWDSSIEWRDCPIGLVKGIMSVAFLAKKQKKDLPGIVVTGQYILASTSYQFCRYRLDSPVPFDMLFCPGGILKVLSKLRNRRNLRVARYDGNPHLKRRGIVFDFGDTRIFYSDDQENFNIRAALESIEVKHSIIYMNKVIDTGGEHLFELTENKDILNDFNRLMKKWGEHDGTLRLKIQTDKLHIFLKIPGKLKAKAKIPVVTHSDIPTGSFEVDRECFSDVAPKAGLMGFREFPRQPEHSEQHYLLYFKDGKYETIFQASKTNKRTKEGSK